jgi:membrane protein required for colicin V production
MHMAWVDIALITVLVLSIVVGLMRGLVFEVLSLLGWVVAYFAAQWLAQDLAPHLPLGKPGSAVNHGAAFVALFVGVLIVWSLVSRLVSMLIKASPISTGDRLLGAGFGFIRGMVLLLVVATVVALTPLAKSAGWKDSQGAVWLHGMLNGLKPVLPPKVAQYLPE